MARLIDADATKDAICQDECGKSALIGRCDRCRFVDVMNEQPTVDAVPLKPLCGWLSLYAAPPIIGERINIYDPGERERAWEMVLREIDWGDEPWTE